MKKLVKDQGGEGAQQAQPVSTKAVAMSQAKRRTEIQEKKKREEAAKKEEADRLKVQNTLKGPVQAALKSKFGESAASKIATKTAERKADQRAADRKAQSNLKEAIGRARSRPMLFEQSARDNKAASNLAYLKATQKMIDLLQKNGENPDKYLPERAKELIEEDKLRQQLKQKYQGQQ